MISRPLLLRVIKQFVEAVLIQGAYQSGVLHRTVQMTDCTIQLICPCRTVTNSVLISAKERFLTRY